METLLEKAIKTKIYKSSMDITEEDEELIIAWLKKEITHGQIRKVKELKGATVYNFIAFGIRQLNQKGKIKIEKR